MPNRDPFDKKASMSLGEMCERRVFFWAVSKGRSQYVFNAKKRRL